MFPLHKKKCCCEHEKVVGMETLLKFRILTLENVK